MKSTTGYGTVVSARDLSIEYRAETAKSRHIAVRGVSFDLFDGEILGLIGESGSGKSTLAAAIAAAVSSGATGTGMTSTGRAGICGGTLSIFDTDMKHASGHRRRLLTQRIGYLAQDGAERLKPRLTVAENVTEPLFLRNRRFDVREAGQIAATVVDSVHLPLSLLERRPWELSSGQIQRVALARALVLEPELLVADEPIHGVDIMVRQDVLDIIPELQGRRGFSAVVVSSDLAVVRRIAERIAVLHRGMIIGIGSLGSLVADPSHPYLAALARAMREEGSGDRMPRPTPQKWNLSR